MATNPIILVGGPDSGKSNFLARLWLAFRSGRFDLKTVGTPDNIKYIESIAAHLLSGKFVPRTDPEDLARDFSVDVRSERSGISAQLILPDIYGEIWEKAVRTLEIPDKWLSTLKGANSAILFVRVQSENNFDALDWVVSEKLLKQGFGDEKHNKEIPIQVTLIELLRFIDQNINRSKQRIPKVAVIVTAWDLLHHEEAAEGPEGYLNRQFPMFAGRLKDIKSLEVKVFGTSVVGGDLKVEDFMKAFLEKTIDETGYSLFQDGKKSSEHTPDLTEPVNWLLS